ncbi:unnamed protein product [Brachionus calyciflorus]|uniref:Uncharacterized protein n=1 Tax=Brachionus calyciflorus TaxID=104777 RepID=A0A813X6W0_9BILA|nr:unnamed protein product [Brachionus calyciflorus]
MFTYFKESNDDFLRNNNTIEIIKDGITNLKEKIDIIFKDPDGTKGIKSTTSIDNCFLELSCFICDKNCINFIFNGLNNLPNFDSNNIQDRSNYSTDLTPNSLNKLNLLNNHFIKYDFDEIIKQRKKLEKDLEKNIVRDSTNQNTRIKEHFAFNKVYSLKAISGILEIEINQIREIENIDKQNNNDADKLIEEFFKLADKFNKPEFYSDSIQKNKDCLVDLRNTNENNIFNSIKNGFNDQQINKELDFLCGNLENNTDTDIKVIGPSFVIVAQHFEAIFKRISQRSNNLSFNFYLTEWYKDWKQAIELRNRLIHHDNSENGQIVEELNSIVLPWHKSLKMFQHINNGNQTNLPIQLQIIVFLNSHSQLNYSQSSIMSPHPF